MTDDEITSELNQTQIKSRRIIPSKGFTFKTKRPLVSRTGFIPGRTDQPITETESYLGKATWLENGPGENHGGAPNNDQRRIIHLGYTVLCRRVDLGPMIDLAPVTGTPAPEQGSVMGAMQWRVNTQASAITVPCTKGRFQRLRILFPKRLSIFPHLPKIDS